MSKTWFSLDPYNFGFVQEKMDIVGQTVMYGALKSLEEAIDRNAERQAREMLYAYLMEGGDPEELLADIGKWLETKDDD